MNIENSRSIDGSKEAKLAFDKAIEVAKRNHAKLVLAHVIDTRSLQTPTGFEGNFSDEIRKQAENLFAEYVMLRLITSRM